MHLCLGFKKADRCNSEDWQAIAFRGMLWKVKVHLLIEGIIIPLTDDTSKSSGELALLEMTPSQATDRQSYGNSKERRKLYIMF